MLTIMKRLWKTTSKASGQDQSKWFIFYPLGSGALLVSSLLSTFTRLVISLFTRQSPGHTMEALKLFQLWKITMPRNRPLLIVGDSKILFPSTRDSKKTDFLVKLLHLTSWNHHFHHKHISLFVSLEYPCPSSSHVHPTITRHAISCFVRR